MSAKFTANQTAVLNVFGDSTDSLTPAMIGETLTDMKLSAIGTVARSLVKRGVLVADGDKFKAPADETAQPLADDTETDAGEPVAEHDEEAADTVPAADYDPAIAKARELLKAKAEFQTTSKGDMAKVITVGKAYVTTDGKHFTAKIGTSPKTPWVLFAVTGKKVTKAGEFKSSSAALMLDVLTD